MPLYLVAIHRPTHFDHAAHITEPVRRDIDALNDAMVAAGIRVFVGGLRPTHDAQVVLLDPHGHPSTGPGPLLHAPEYVDGFWVLDLPDMTHALSWARRAALACRGNVEVRPFHG